jgi:fatty acid desaturase
VFLALIFAPAHIGLPIMREHHHDWIHQLETTRNLQLPRAISFFFIGLDYQVEHHLFPKIPHQNLPRAAEITRAWCAKNGVVYHTVPYLFALGDAAHFIAHAWSRDADDPVEVRAGLVGHA